MKRKQFIVRRRRWRRRWIIRWKESNSSLEEDKEDGYLVIDVDEYKDNKKKMNNSAEKMTPKVIIGQDDRITWPHTHKHKFVLQSFKRIKIYLSVYNNNTYSFKMENRIIRNEICIPNRNPMHYIHIKSFMTNLCHSNHQSMNKSKDY